VAKLLALGSLFVASYDLQSYGGGILTRLHTGCTMSGELGLVLAAWHQ
jgi:hypothetical protein